MDRQIKQVNINRDRLLNYWKWAKPLYIDKSEYVYHVYMESSYYFEIPDVGFFWFEWTGTKILDAHGVITSKKVFDWLPKIETFLKDRIFQVSGAGTVRISVPEEFHGMCKLLDKLNPNFSSTTCKRFKGITRIHKMVLFSRGG